MLAIGASAPVAYDWPPAWNGGDGCSGGLLPGTREIADHIAGEFEGVTTIGGDHYRQNTANPNMTSVHGSGRAMDIHFERISGQANNGQGDPVANWLIENAAAIGIQYIVWDRTEWQGWDGVARPYSGPHPHDDHIHAELTEEAAAMQTPWF